MSFPVWGALAVVLYILALVGLSRFRARGADLNDYLLGGRNSTWWLLTIGMISDSISGVTYVSVPGAVAVQSYSYLQIIFGHFFGYQLIAFILLPIYYRENSVSIYSYLRDRFGITAERTGASFFVIARLFGSAARLYIATSVLHAYFFGALGLSPVISFTAAMILIVLYTYQGGIKSLVWTDAFQSCFLLLGIVSIFGILASDLPSPWEVLSGGTIFQFADGNAKNYFFKHFIGGIFITVAMNGLDQNIMQKNLSCARLVDAQKNMSLFGFVLVAVNLVFVGLGALVLATYQQKGIPLPLNAAGGPALDRLLPELVFQHLGQLPSVLLILGLTAATLSSADSVLPTLSSSIQLDLMTESHRKRVPIRVIHLLVAVAIWCVILMLYYVKAQSLIDLVLRYAGYVSGPLLGLYGVGILTRVELRDRAIPFCAVGAIVLTAILEANSKTWFEGYQIGFELILVNALFFVALALALGRLRSSRPS